MGVNVDEMMEKIMKADLDSSTRIFIGNTEGKTYSEVGEIVMTEGKDGKKVMVLFGSDWKGKK